jgi:hypothetical protein
LWDSASKTLVDAGIGDISATSQGVMDMNNGLSEMRGVMAASNASLPLHQLLAVLGAVSSSVFGMDYYGLANNTYVLVDTLGAQPPAVNASSYNNTTTFETHFNLPFLQTHLSLSWCANQYAYNSEGATWLDIQLDARQPTVAAVITWTDSIDPPTTMQLQLADTPFHDAVSSLAVTAAAAFEDKTGPQLLAENTTLLRPVPGMGCPPSKPVASTATSDTASAPTTCGTLFEVSAAYASTSLQAIFSVPLAGAYNFVLKGSAADATLALSVNSTTQDLLHVAALGDRHYRQSTCYSLTSSSGNIPLIAGQQLFIQLNVTDGDVQVQVWFPDGSVLDALPAAVPTSAVSSLRQVKTFVATLSAPIKAQYVCVSFVEGTMLLPRVRFVSQAAAGNRSQPYNNAANQTELLSPSVAKMLLGLGDLVRNGPFTVAAMDALQQNVSSPETGCTVFNLSRWQANLADVSELEYISEV